MSPVYTVGHRRYAAGLPDRHGNPREGHAPAVDFHVYAIAPVSSIEPDSSRAGFITGISLIAPAGSVVDARDLFEVDGVTYEVTGEVADYTRNPFGFEAGVVINLTRTEG